MHTNKQLHYCFIHTACNFRRVFIFNKFLWKDPSWKMEWYVLHVSFSANYLKKQALFDHVQSKALRISAYSNVTLTGHPPVLESSASWHVCCRLCYLFTIPLSSLPLVGFACTVYLLIPLALGLILGLALTNGGCRIDNVLPKHGLIRQCGLLLPFLVFLLWHHHITDRRWLFPLGHGMKGHVEHSCTQPTAWDRHTAADPQTPEWEVNDPCFKPESWGLFVVSITGKAD